MYNSMQEWADAVYLAEMKQREDWLRLYIRPRPSWLPEWAWKWVLARLLFLTEQRDV